MSVLQSGKRSIPETSSLVDQGYLQDSSNFVNGLGCIEVRQGATVVNENIIDNRTAQIVGDVPICIKQVQIASQKLVFYVASGGQLYAFHPDKTNFVYKVKRRLFSYNQDIQVHDTSYMGSVAEIHEVANFIYVFGSNKQWVIRKDGLLKFVNYNDDMTPWAGNDYILVDAIDATICDLDNIYLNLTKTGKTSSFIPKDTNLFARTVSELGGRGGVSNEIRVKETDGYIVDLNNKLTYRDLNSSSTDCTIYTPATYGIGCDLPQQRSDSEDREKGIKLFKNILAYGVCVKYFLDEDVSYLAIYTNSGDTTIKPGTRVGITISNIYDDDGNKCTWTDAEVIDPDELTTNGKLALYNINVENKNLICLKIEGDTIGPALAIAPGTVDLTSYSWDETKVGMLPIHVLTGEYYTTYGLLWQNVDGGAYITYAPEYGDSVKLTSPWKPLFETYLDASVNYYQMATMVYDINRAVVNQPLGLMSIREELANATGTGYIKGYYYIDGDPYTKDGAINLPIRYTVYTEDYPWYYRTSIYKANLKKQKQESGALGGSLITVDILGDGKVVHSDPTWFKDSCYPFKLPLYQHVTQGIDVQFILPLIAIHDPHNITPYSGFTKDVNFVMTSPSKSTSMEDGTPHINMWYTPRISPSLSDGVITYNPYVLVDENGDVVIVNDKSTAMPDTSIDGAYFALIKDIEASVGENHKNNKYEIYTSTIDQQAGKVIPIKVGEELSIFDRNLMIGFNTLGKTYIQKTVEDSIYKHFPILLSNVSTVSAVSTDHTTRSIGDFSNVVYFNGKFYFSSGNTIKITNELLEWSTVNTLSLQGSVNCMASLNQMLYVFTTSGIYTVNTKNEIQKFSNIVAKIASVFGEKLVFVDEYNRVYHTEFSQIPVGDQWQLTNNPYIVKVEDTEIIDLDRESWDIIDLVSTTKNLYVNTTKGVYLLDLRMNTWWPQKYEMDVEGADVTTPTALKMYKLFTFDDDVYAVSGNYGIYIPDKFIDIKYDSGGG